MQVVLQKRCPLCSYLSKRIFWWRGFGAGVICEIKASGLDEWLHVLQTFIWNHLKKKRVFGPVVMVVKALNFKTRKSHQRREFFF